MKGLAGVCPRPCASQVHKGLYRPLCGLLPQLASGARFTEGETPLRFGAIAPGSGPRSSPFMRSVIQLQPGQSVRIEGPAAAFALERGGGVTVEDDGRDRVHQNSSGSASRIELKSRPWPRIKWSSTGRPSTVPPFTRRLVRLMSSLLEAVLPLG